MVSKIDWTFLGISLFFGMSPAGTLVRMRTLFLKVIFVVFVSLSSAAIGYGGITSKFVRSEWPSVDIPVNHEVFAIPKGHNAPQQVSSLNSSLNMRQFLLEYSIRIQHLNGIAVLLLLLPFLTLFRLWWSNNDLFKW